MEKSSIFENELKYIKNENIRDFVAKTLDRLPDYFFSIPASSTGKYHPNYALGEGGLVRHTKACVIIAMELLRLEMFSIYPQEDRDIIIASLILHDGTKNGVQGGNFSITTHPLVMSDFVFRTNQNLQILNEETIQKIANNISHHMGEWVFDYKTNEQVLEKPQGKMQNFVHMCDYLASRKSIEINFEVGIS